MKELTCSAFAKVVPEIAEDIMSSVIAELGLGGRLPFVGRGGGMVLPDFTEIGPSGDDRWTLIFALVTLLGIRIGEGVGFRVDVSELCRSGSATKREDIRMHIYILTFSAVSSKLLRA